jgi:phosphatidylserine/phosphatidylglycerophosphate/cardiolipin synthase-like enzyme
MIRRSRLLALMLALSPALVLAAPGPGLPQGSPGTVEVVESVPRETVLDLPALRNAPEVWVGMIQAAQRTLDIETFYFSEDPAGPDALDRVLDAVAAAARRGVRVRAIADAGMNRTYPEICQRISALPGAECRLLNARSLWGGIQHAKFFVVDGAEFFLGSQNWDWRALEQIHESGVRVRDPALAGAIGRIFETDWNLAASGVTAPPGSSAAAPATTARLITAHGDTVRAELAASPPKGLPEGIPWDLPKLTALVDSARTTVRLQLLTYSPAERGGGYWPVLDEALRRAAARGVRVRLIFSNWSKRKSSAPWIKSLAAVPNVTVKFTNIPPFSGGFLPFARVEHAKFLVADDDACWLGTSNGSRDYFEESRNVSLFFHGRHGQGVAADLTAFFDVSWNGPYAEVVSPCGEYEPPKTSE